MAKELAAYAKSKGIKFFLFNFTDLFGTQRAKLVPAEAVGAMQKTGAGFAGFASWLDMTPAHPDMFVMPDPDSVTQLPWKPEVAWVAGDPWMEGAPLAQGPRNVLKRLTAEAKKKNLRMMTGVEPEFHLILPDGSNISDERDTQPKPCYDQSAVMRRFDIIAEICTTMIKLGWGPYQNDHEDANGQFEINWDYTDALVTADRLCFFKFMVKSIAEKHGLRATFMPKPFSHITGNGCHVHVSVWNNTGKKNLFHDKKGELGLSKTCYQFLGGVMHHAVGMTAITNPTVNSYKRINSSQTLSGASWSPNTVTYGGNNRTHMVRIPDEGRFEMRLADGAANAYMLMASILAAGLHGIDEEMDPGKRLDIDMYAEGHKIRGAKKLPLNLLDAIRHFSSDRYLQEALGKEFSDAFVNLKTREWNEFTRHLSQWELDNSLDC
ncbi:MAG: glutamine synthetase type III [Parasphingorhabdus sp.]|jgi:glutamine synthetase type III